MSNAIEDGTRASQSSLQAVYSAYDPAQEVQMETHRLSNILIGERSDAILHWHYSKSQSSSKE